MTERNDHDNGTIDAATARELLAHDLGDAYDPSVDERAIRLWWLIQHRLIKDANHPERSSRIAELHTHCTRFPADKQATTELAALEEEIRQEALAQLRQEEAAIAHGDRKDHWNIS